MHQVLWLTDSGIRGGGGVILEISAGVENLFLKNVPEQILLVGNSMGYKTK